MWKYVCKRIVLAMVTLFIIVTTTFFAMNLVPGGPFNREKALTPQVKAELERRYNLDKPLPVQYSLYLKSIVQGDFGVSLKNGRQITDMIGQGFKVSGRLGLYAVLTALLFGITLGVIAALFRNGLFDRIIIFCTSLLVSVPSFVLATILLMVFGVWLGLFKIWSSDGASLLFPTISLSLYPMAYITRLTKSSMLDVLGQDYVRTARSKGLSRPKVVVKHALRNALLPVITYVGPLTAYILTGSLVVETVFTLPGLGGIFVKSIQESDYPLIMATTIFLGLLMVIMTLASDLLYKTVDPRITFK